MKSLIATLSLALLVFSFTSQKVSAKDASKKDTNDMGRIRLVQKADLVVSNFSFRVIDPHPSGHPGKQLFQFSFTVKNIASGARAASTSRSLTRGGMAALSRGRFHVTFLNKSTSPSRQLGEKIVAPLGPGASRTVTFNRLLPVPYGGHYGVVVDSTNWIDEWNEDNNAREFPVVVSGGYGH